VRKHFPSSGLLIRLPLTTQKLAEIRQESAIVTKQLKVRALLLANNIDWLRLKGFNVYVSCPVCSTFHKKEKQVENCAFKLAFNELKAKLKAKNSQLEKEN
jgi:hypothetical protein